MIHFATLAFTAVVSIGVFTWLSLPGARWQFLATASFVCMTILAFVGAIESTGQPKPLQLEWRNVLDSQIIGLDWDEARQIVWVWIKHDGEPIAYSLPWPKDAKQMGVLQDRWRRKGVSGDEFNLSMDGDIAKVKPPAPQPEKTR